MEEQLRDLMANQPTRRFERLFHMLQKSYHMLWKCGLKIRLNHRNGTTDIIAIITRLSDLPEHQRVYGDIINKKFAPQGGDRLQALWSLQPEKVFYKGLPGYKQVLMYENYAPFVPKQYHSDDLYKKPSEDVLKSEKEDQDERKSTKR